MCYSLLQLICFVLSFKFYSYAGLQGGKNCFCGSKYGSYGADNDSSCNITCYKNINQKCGGDMLNSVFDTGQKGEKSHAFLILNHQHVMAKFGNFKLDLNAETNNYLPKLLLQFLVHHPI